MYKYCVTNGRNINSTDECYTPPAVYDTVLDYAVERYQLKGKHIVRPFIPGGDYQQYVGDVTLTNRLNGLVKKNHLSGFTILLIF